MPYDNLATSAFEASGMPMDNEYAVEALREFLTNYPDNWKTPYNNIINEIDSLEEQLGGREITVKVNKKDITIKPTGEMFFADGKPVTDTVLQNQASIAKEKRNETLRTSISGGFSFFILSDNKILLSGKNNVGKEYIADPEMMQRILDKAVIYKKTC
jgi:ATPase subunit of ABC transporter with duplicated ATPase domains